MKDIGPIKCAECGTFVATDEMTDGRAKFHYEPETEFGHELTEWVCERCIQRSAMAREQLQRGGYV